MSKINSLESLREALETEAATLLGRPSVQQLMEPGFADVRLYALYLTETFHYTRHNSRNQALVAVRDERIDIRYAKFCLNHALEETGHEMMALHDLKSLGVAIDETSLPKPLAETQALIAYLYRISQTGNPVARLGYSYWAERSYSFIQPLLTFAAGQFGLKKTQMTFLSGHAEIDEQHAVDVDKAIAEFVKTPADWAAVHETMVHTLRLTSTMLEAVLEQFTLLKNGEETRYDFAKELGKK